MCYLLIKAKDKRDGVQCWQVKLALIITHAYVREQIGAVDSFAVSAACSNWLSKGGTVGLYEWIALMQRQRSETN